MGGDPAADIAYGRETKPPAMVIASLKIAFALVVVVDFLEVGIDHVFGAAARRFRRNPHPGGIAQPARLGFASACWCG